MICFCQCVFVCRQVNWKSCGRASIKCFWRGGTCD